MSENTAGRVTSRKPRKRPKGYAAWSPHPPTRALLQQVNEILEEYRDHLPLTVRQIFYRLVAAYDYPKDEKAYDRLSDKLVLARRARMLPFDVIRDDGVVSYSDDWHADPQHFWDDTGERIKRYRRDRQTGQRVRMELWCESAGMAPQLARVADEFSVPVFTAGGGFNSLTGVRQIVERARLRDQPTVLLHVGDYDPSGASIFEATSEDAIAFLEQDRIVGIQTIRPVRVALTLEQVNTYQLPTKPPKETDSRSAGWEGETCQLEALEPDELADIVETAIVGELNTDTYGQQLEHEVTDRIELWRGLPRGDS